MTSQWHYKVVTFTLGWKGFDYSKVEEQLNIYGSDGWEVVSTMAPSYGAGQAVELAAFLKRVR